MIKKIKAWWQRRKLKGTATGLEPESYTREQMQKIYELGHSDGRKEGLAIARQQALNSVRELLREQNK